MLKGLDTGSFDPRGIPSPLIGKPMPRFTLPAQPNINTNTNAHAEPATTMVDSSTLVARHQPFLLNFFASWCVPCVEEAPMLGRLRAHDIPIIGIAYKDATAATARFLATNGNPYRQLARDASGDTGLDFGLTGVPETYVVDRAGIIRLHYVGPITDGAATGTLRPLLAQLATAE